MATYSKATLSGSTNGKGILVAAVATLGTNIHTGSATTTTLHEVWMYASNTDTTARKLTIEWGGATVGDIFELTIPAESGLVLVVPGLILKGVATPLVVTAFASLTNVINITGYVNVIT